MVSRGRYSACGPFWPWATSGVLQIHDEVPGSLDDPVRGGVRGGAEDPDAAGGVLDDRQDVLALAGQGDGLDEVAGQQRARLGMKEVDPKVTTAATTMVGLGLGDGQQ